MTPEQQAFYVVFLANLPFVAIILIALYKGWIVLGPTHRTALKEHDAESTFREQLRQESIADKKAAEERAATIAGAMKELTNVVAGSADLIERLVDESDRTSWDGTDRRANPASTRTRRRA